MACEKIGQGRIEMKQVKSARRQYALIGFDFIDFNDTHFQESSAKRHF